MIEVKNLTKDFKDRRAVDDVSFVVKPGVVTGFLGPNGAGKSTTMRLMLGLDRGSGETYFDGKRLGEYPVPSHVVGLLLDAKAFHPTRTARNHLRVLAAAGGIADTRVDEVLGIVGLSEVADKKPGSFSMGMAQRLGIAAAILGKPKYLLLDEPGNGLDPEGILWLRNFMRTYAAAGNVVFVSSHLLSEMSQMASDVIVIGKGRLLANTSIEELVSEGVSTGTFVRARARKKLVKVLEKNNLRYQEEGEGLLVHDTDTDTIGKLAHAAGVAVLELSSKSTSLEDVFLHITADAQEYRGTSKGDSDEIRS